MAGHNKFPVKNFKVIIFKAYITISKPRLVGLLYFTGLSSMLIASSIYGFNIKSIVLSSLAIILGVMGSNATTAYIDREMDAVMFRTKKRPVPAGVISPARNALIYGLVLVFAGIAIAAFLNWLAAVFIFLGFLDSALIYNLISKRRSPLNIVFSAPAGGMPVFAGWVAVTGGKISLIAVLMFLLVFIWTPMHIWSLAFFFREDYRNANVPMLPVVWSSRKVFVMLAVMNLIMILLSVFTGFYLRLSFIYLAIVIALGAVIIVLSIILLVKNSRKFAWILFKYSSPYLAAVFLILVVEFLWI